MQDVSKSNGFLEESADFFIDACLFGMPYGLQKCMQISEHPNFRKKYVDPCVVRPAS